MNFPIVRIFSKCVIISSVCDGMISYHSSKHTLSDVFNLTISTINLQCSFPMIMFTSAYLAPCLWFSCQHIAILMQNTRKLWRICPAKTLAGGELSAYLTSDDYAYQAAQWFSTYQIPWLNIKISIIYVNIRCTNLIQLVFSQHFPHSHSLSQTDSCFIHSPKKYYTNILQHVWISLTQSFSTLHPTN